MSEVQRLAWIVAHLLIPKMRNKSMKECPLSPLEAARLARLIHE